MAEGRGPTPGDRPNPVRAPTSSSGGGGSGGGGSGGGVKIAAPRVLALKPVRREAAAKQLAQRELELEKDRERDETSHAEASSAKASASSSSSAALESEQAPKRLRAASGPVNRRGGPTSLADCRVDVLHRSDDFLVIDKPADFRLDGDFPVTVENYVKQLIPDEAKRPRWVHQLDFATSGVLCIGLCRRGAGNASKLFQQRLTRKYYVALVKGRLRPPAPGAENPTSFHLPPRAPPTEVTKSAPGNNTSAEVRHEALRYAPGQAAVRVCERWEQACAFGIGTDGSQQSGDKGNTEPNAATSSSAANSTLLERLLRERHGLACDGGLLPVYDVEGAIAEPSKDDFRMVIDNQNGREARTQVVPVAYGKLHGEDVTKVILRPIQGRRHQLRLHCMHLGFPIIGDATYGPVFCNANSTVGDDAFYMVPSRMYLHALRLELNFAKHKDKVRYKDGRNFMNGNLRDLILETSDPFPLPPE